MSARESDRTAGLDSVAWTKSATVSAVPIAAARWMPRIRSSGSVDRRRREAYSVPTCARTFVGRVAAGAAEVAGVAGDGDDGRRPGCADATSAQAVAAANARAARPRFLSR